MLNFWRLDETNVCIKQLLTLLFEASSYCVSSASSHHILAGWCSWRWTTTPLGGGQPLHLETTSHSARIWWLSAFLVFSVSRSKMRKLNVSVVKIPSSQGIMDSHLSNIPSMKFQFHGIGQTRGTSWCDINSRLYELNIFFDQLELAQYVIN